MSGQFNTYNLKARALPIYIAIAPILLVLTTLVSDDSKLEVGGTAAGIFALLSFFLGQISADFGKRLEKRLWESWGGPPTTRFLRHGNREFNSVTRDRVHVKLRGIGLYVPTSEEQEQDRDEADLHYQSCTEELIRRTRDHSKFRLVFTGLTEYGFRRNLLSLKVVGTCLTITGLTVAVRSLFTAWDATNKLSVVSLLAGALSIGLLAIWLFWVTKRTVKISAERYARFLLEAALEQE